jgi:hypothetical protein
LAGEAEGAFRPDIFTAAFDEFGKRHDVLRSKFSFSGGRDSKVILPRLPIDVRVHDLTGLPEQDRRPSGLSILANEVRQVFDLAGAPLLKAAAVKLTLLLPGRLRSRDFGRSFGWPSLVGSARTLRCNRIRTGAAVAADPAIRRFHRLA